jgi:hypothetical protein
MPAPISMDLRLRIVGAVERSSSIREAARRFAVSPSAAVKLMQQVRGTDSAAPARYGGSRRRVLDAKRSRSVPHWSKRCPTSRRPNSSRTNESSFVDIHHEGPLLLLKDRFLARGFQAVSQARSASPDP